MNAVMCGHTRFTKIHLWMDDGNELVMTDARGLGRILLRDDPVNQPPLCRLGFDPYIKPREPCGVPQGPQTPEKPR